MVQVQKIVRSVHIDRNQQEDKHKLPSVKIVETLGALGFFIESAISQIPMQEIVERKAKCRLPLMFPKEPVTGEHLTKGQRRGGDPSDEEVTPTVQNEQISKPFGNII
jgi:hypothetical protein